MTFPIYRFHKPIITLIVAGVIFLSFPATVGTAYQIGMESKKVLFIHQVESKKVWVQKNTPLKKSKSVKDQKIHAQIINVITDYKTGFKEKEKEQISRHILSQSDKYGYDPLFLTALIITESSFNHRAKSKVGALGLMQIRPRTGKALATEANMKWRGKRTLYHPGKNIALGSYYLNKLIKRFGDLNTALEAYNHGPTRTARYLLRGKKTKDYSGKVFAIYNQIRIAKAEL